MGTAPGPASSEEQADPQKRPRTEAAEGLPNANGLPGPPAATISGRRHLSNRVAVTLEWGGRKRVELDQDKENIRWGGR
ncbi:hypothetical protein CRG98_031220 [Punica granatum]|uniref:Uncharacterized protein n=1 Tax=Punica granatum TaxID=22663 RepID=A0A2I0IWI5_PUNGR|nr:hypothetical protein CRG98_031220 [Punica granatum]